MGLLDALFHLLHFIAPALFVAVLLALAARFFMKKGVLAPGLFAQAAINFIACLAALFGGLWFFGNDGKMATYAALVLAGASSQAWMLRGRAN